MAVDDDDAAPPPEYSYEYSRRDCVLLRGSDISHPALISQPRSLRRGSNSHTPTGNTRSKPTVPTDPSLTDQMADAADGGGGEVVRLNDEYAGGQEAPPAGAGGEQPPPANAEPGQSQPYPPAPLAQAPGRPAAALTGHLTTPLLASRTTGARVARDRCCTLLAVCAAFLMLPPARPRADGGLAAAQRGLTRRNPSRSTSASSGASAGKWRTRISRTRLPSTTCAARRS